MNKIIVSGNICNDIETNTYNDKLCIKNSIAVKRNFKNKNGEYDTDFFNIVLWGSHAEYISKYAKKGNKILISGKLLNCEYETEDKTKKRYDEIMVEQIEIISSKKENKEQNNEEIIDSKNALQQEEDEEDIFG